MNKSTATNLSISRGTREPVWNEHKAANFFGQSVMTLRAWRRIGKGPKFLKLGRSVRYAPEDCYAYLDSCTVKSTSEV